MQNLELFVNKWEKIRENGKLRYVTTTGIIMGLLLMTGAIIGRLFFYQPFKKTHWYTYFIYFFEGLTGGVFFSLIKWYFNEKKYKYSSQSILIDD